ncbi:hypothetical protein O6H91_21G039900 [Diphasiastrum complanatum]|uniref:Uncharacterized protein n=1 Tax=Diphasiastrum complanatum TaxID=34168 RepID=A0ACC2AJN2_DIPCM|nr:hypothetical protein O6H91_21G039900 [Diphasiastrum complanatum]
MCRSVLLKVKEGIKEDPLGVLSGWDRVRQPDFCSWGGVGCDVSKKRVVSLNLSRSELAGELTASVGNLTFLVVIDLSFNRFRGAVPAPALSLCRYLATIDLSFNSFSGPIPPELGQLGHLNILRLTGNAGLNGSIPREIGDNCTRLTALEIGQTNISGSIPFSLEKCLQLVTLALFTNLNLGGTIPGELGSLRNLKVLDLSNNSLIGGIPSSIGNLYQLERLDLRWNFLNGAIPSHLGQLSKLQILALDGNNFNGSVLEVLGQLSELQNMTLSSNLLTGNISTEIWINMSKLEVLNLGNNSLEGTIPETLAKLRSLRILWMPNNLLMGDLPAALGSLGNLTYLSFEQNSIRGTIPDSFAQLHALTTLNLGGNRLAGEVPWPVLGALSTLQNLSLYSNKFNGTLPSDYGKLSQLNELNLANNTLTGHIPEELCNSLRNLAVLHLETNSFEGPLPSSIGMCYQLQILRIASNRLRGEIPRSIGNCSELRVISAWNNSFFGEIPHEIGNLSYLTLFNFDINNLNGSLPEELGQLSQMQHLSMSLNAFSGPVPKQLGQLSQLQFLNLGSSFLSGSIPPELFNSTFNLEEIHLDQNLLTGEIPESIANAYSLTILWFHHNKLNGTIPSVIGNMRNLSTLSLGNNTLTGRIPESLANLNKLKNLDLAMNNFTGEIPSFLANLTQLQSIWLHSNALYGQIPSWIGNLSQLQYLYLGNNNFQGSIPEQLGELSQLWYLALDRNNLSGTIPQSLSKLSQLQFLDLASNTLSGKILIDFSNFSSGNNLTLLLGANQLTGRFPGSLQNCSLKILDLSDNHLSGALPAFSNETFLSRPILNLEVLSLRSNNFSGEVPAWIWSLQQLELLDLSQNSFTGRIPRDFSRLHGLNSIQKELQSCTRDDISPYEHKQVLVFEVAFDVKGGFLTYTYVCSSNTMLDLSNNKLEGEIPPELNQLIGLRLLNLSYNTLSGQLANNLAPLSLLEQLDISHNNLSGPFPSSLSQLNSLGVLDISANNFWGTIPVENGFDTRFNSSSFSPGNPGLCGLPLSKLCNNSSQTTSSPRSAQAGEHTHTWIYAVPATAVVALAVLGMGVIWWLKRIKARRPITLFSSEVNFFLHHGFKTSVENITSAIEALSLENRLGSGTRSTVYKAVLPGDLIIAVKKIELDDDDGNDDLGAREDFDREIQTLGKLRHRNLVKLFGMYSKSNSKALLLEYMPNGSLHKQLHELEGNAKSQQLCNWETRLNIAIGIADAIVYLHQHSHQPIIHLDLKPSNILLDSDFIPKVADFGIAKFVKHPSTGEASASRLYGTSGYIPPEYGASSKVSTKGDVYSYGIILLELLTRKQPTHPLFQLAQTISLRQWALQAFMESRMEEIIDKDLLDQSHSMHRNHGHQKLRQMELTMRVSFLCTQDAAQDRPSMIQVRSMLRQIQLVVSTTISQVIPTIEDLLNQDACNDYNITSSTSSSK